MKAAPRIYTIKNGKLTLKDQNITPQRHSQPYKIIQYSHTVRASPDQYHTEMIKQYRKQNDQLRKNYKQLQSAYFHLLGYQAHVQSHSYLNKQNILNPIQSHATPIHQIYKDLTGPNSTSLCQSTSKHSSSANVSSFSIDQIYNDIISQSRKKGQRLSQSILEQQVEQFRRNTKQQNHQNNQPKYQRSRKRNAKTQTDQDIQQLLIQAFKQVQQLREMIDTVKNNSAAEIEQIRAQYQDKIYNLQQMLEKQRKQTRMLNGVINRMREEIQTKQGFFRAIKEIKNGPQKILIDKLLKLNRVNL